MLKATRLLAFLSILTIGLYWIWIPLTYFKVRRNPDFETSGELFFASMLAVMPWVVLAIIMGTACAFILRGERPGSVPSDKRLSMQAIWAVAFGILGVFSNILIFN